MEEIEIPTEKLQEEIHHQAEHAAGEAARWISQVALGSAILAALAAVSALLSGHHANEAMIEQIRSSDHWAHYQAKSIKSSILAAKRDLLGSKSEASGSPAHELTEKDQEKAKEYENELAELSKEAQAEEASSKAHLAQHQILSRAVTFFQIAISIGAIAALTKKRRFWWVALSAGGVGLVFLIQGLLS